MQPTRAIETIEAAAMPAKPRDLHLRGKTQKERTTAIRALLRDLGIKDVSVKAARGSMCYWTELRFDIPATCHHDTAGERFHCEHCRRYRETEAKIGQIILAAFPDMDDRSDSMVDHFDFMFTIHTDRVEVAAPAEAPAAPSAAEPATVLRLVPATEAPAQPEPPAPAAPLPPTFKPLQLEFPAMKGARFFGNSADIWSACQDLYAADREHFVVFYLDARHRQIGDRYTMAIGTVTGVEVHPREVFREAVKRNAVALACVHNHPSGDPAPSVQDRALTQRLADAGTLLGVALLDHVVVSTNGYASLAALGAIPIQRGQ